MAERGGFEPPIALRLCLISSQVHSTGLCHLSNQDLSLPAQLRLRNRDHPAHRAIRDAQSHILGAAWIGVPDPRVDAGKGSFGARCLAEQVRAALQSNGGAMQQEFAFIPKGAT